MLVFVLCFVWLLFVCECLILVGFELYGFCLPEVFTVAWGWYNTESIVFGCFLVIGLYLWILLFCWYFVVCVVFLLLGWFSAILGFPLFCGVSASLVMLYCFACSFWDFGDFFYFWIFWFWVCDFSVLCSMYSDCLLCVLGVLFVFVLCGCVTTGVFYFVLGLMSLFLVFGLCCFRLVVC